MNKQATNKSSQKFPIILILAAGILIAGLGGWVAFSHYQKTQDRARFSEAEAIKAGIVEQLKEYLGDNVEWTADNDECFNTEQGPYDNGKLWCQSTTTIVIENDIAYDTVGDTFLASQHDGIANRNASSGDIPVMKRYTIMIKNGITCNLVMNTSKGERFGSATSTRYIPNDESVVSVACSDRARAKHYPFTE